MLPPASLHALGENHMAITKPRLTNLLKVNQLKVPGEFDAGWHFCIQLLPTGEDHAHTRIIGICTDDDTAVVAPDWGHWSAWSSSLLLSSYL